MEHDIQLTLTNNSGMDWIFEKFWFQIGRLAPGSSWPETILSGDQHTIKAVGIPEGILGSCSGFVEYAIGGQIATFAFSNPLKGDNKLGVGMGDPNYIWENMGNHDYQPYVLSIEIDGKPFNVMTQCSGGSINYAGVTIIPA